MNWQERLKGEQLARFDINLIDFYKNYQNNNYKFTVTLCQVFARLSIFQTSSFFVRSIFQAIPIQIKQIRQYLFMKSNPLDQEAARAAAKRIFQKISFSGGSLQSYQISSLLTDTYEYLKIPFNPTSRDIKTYTEILDANRDGQVTLADLETIALQYLCGPGVLTNQAFDPTAKKQKFENSGITTKSYATTISNSQLETKYNGNIWQSKSTINQQKPARNTSYETNFNNQTQYNEQTRQHLALTRAIFQKNVDQHFTITADRVPQLLSETYQTLGRKGYRPNEQDVRVWMKLCDGNSDGHVQYQEYEYFVVRSLQRSGYQVYK